MTISGYADVNGIQMYYEIHGSGKPLVLIHGGGSTIDVSFGRIIPFLKEDYKVIAVELQAHGRSSDRGTAETFDQDAADVAELLRQLNISRSSVMGFSNGGTTAIVMAMMFPEMIDRLVAISAGLKRDGFFPGFFEMMAGASLDTMPLALQEAFLELNNDRAALQRMHDHDRDRMINFKDFNEVEIRSIKAPTLIINSDRDVVTIDHALEISRLIEGSRLAILPGIHGECIGETISWKTGSRQPEITASLVKEFLSA